MSTQTVKDVLVRKVDVAILEKLKERAKRRNHSLQYEMHSILSDAVKPDNSEDRLKRARAIRESIENQDQTDSVLLIREDRDR